MKLVTILFASLFIISCSSGSKKKAEPPTASNEKIIAVYRTPLGVNEVGIMLRAIKKEAKYDSAKSDYIVVTDTLWGRPVQVKQVDSLGKQRTDSDGTPLFVINYLLIGKDSVDWRVENKNVDTLLKYFTPKSKQ